MSLTPVAESPPDGYRVEWPGSPEVRAQGAIWRDIVEPGIDRCERLAAYVDLPNANVGFEVGYALGRRKAVALLRVRPELPTWLTPGRLLMACFASGPTP